MDVLYSVLSDIANREGVDPVDLEPPLYEVVDERTVDALVSRGPSPQDSQPNIAEFTYYGYSVTVDGSGDITVIDQEEAADETSISSEGRVSEKAIVEIGERERVLKKTADIIAARDRPLVNRLEGLLKVVRDTLGVESAALSYVDTDTYVFEAVDVAPNVELQAGEIVPLAETVCKQVVETEQALVLRDVAVDAPELSDTAFEVSAYLGVPVFVDGDVYGTFCFYDTQARSEAFTEWDLALVEILSKWVSSELEGRKRERALHATTFERPTSGC